MGKFQEIISQCLYKREKVNSHKSSEVLEILINLKICLLNPDLNLPRQQCNSESSIITIYKLMLHPREFIKKTIAR